MGSSVVSLALAAAAAAAFPAAAQDSDAELAKKLSNPVSSLISVPLQLNHDCCFGPDEGYRYTLNVQPVVPVSVGQDWNMIVRTIMPVIYQDRTSPAAGDAQGFGDITQSFFFSPKQPVNGLILAAGPVFLWPVAGQELGSKQWGAGPTGLVLKQDGPWSVGVLANHIWSYADVGDARRDDISQTFVQPFLSWTSPSHTTIGINTESTYNWKSGSWTVPVNLTVAQLTTIGGRKVQFTGGAKVYAAREDKGPAWGLRFVTTLLFPK
ncbi:hypothetical protein [Phenylobacterium sp. J367]|uniref:hypothetical protein n=1 Tax=Phenylobacterium sp. J367 TaxID=2898435 RepID=UPI0021518CC1|nr:hypothetical protein [Phenylobacterium sp. J367]MCR5878883.1 hypothetical protein [Phenylobacterium sp. J367]